MKRAILKLQTKLCKSNLLHKKISLFVAILSVGSYICSIISKIQYESSETLNIKALHASYQLEENAIVLMIFAVIFYYMFKFAYNTKNN